MPLVDTKKMFEMAYKNGYAIGAFNVNNMEITQGIVEAIAEEKAPLILQISRGARSYASMSYLKAIINVAVAENPDIPRWVLAVPAPRPRGRPFVSAPPRWAS